jgi:hypothetical protein
MAVKVLEVTRISAPKGLLRRFHNFCAGGAGLAHNGVDFALAIDVMAERELAGARTRCRDTHIRERLNAGRRWGTAKVVSTFDQSAIWLAFSTMVLTPK